MGERPWDSNLGMGHEGQETFNRSIGVKVFIGESRWYGVSKSARAKKRYKNNSFPRLCPIETTIFDVWVVTFTICNDKWTQIFSTSCF